MTETASKAMSAAASEDVEWAIFSGQDTVCWVTGMPADIEAGNSPFSGGPSLAFVWGEGVTALVVPNTQEVAAHQSSASHVISYAGYSAEEPNLIRRNYQAAIEKALETAPSRASVAVEESLPLGLAKMLDARSTQYVFADDAFARARAYKTEKEVRLLEESARVASLGQGAARRAAVVGATELEVFSMIRNAMEQAANCRLPVTGDLISGTERTYAYTGWPNTRRLVNGDVVLADLAPRVAGYWGDSCNSIFVGDPVPELQRMRDAVKEALDRAVKIAGPGMKASDLDASVRDYLDGKGYHYPHHTGHGIGTSVHEFPRIVPGNDAELGEGMVLLIEPGAYLEGVGGIRLEHMFLMTGSGLQQLTDFEM